MRVLEEPRRATPRYRSIGEARRAPRRRRPPRRRPAPRPSTSLLLTRRPPTPIPRTWGSDVDGFLLFLLANLFVYGDVARDPAIAAWTSQADVRQLECERLSQADADARTP